MTGPEHYRDAEELLDTAVETHDGQAADTNIASAQVHATLALAAATALQAALPLIGDDQQVTEWGHAIGATGDTNQGARISSALELVDVLLQQSLMVPAAADQLRAVLTGHRPAQSSVSVRGGDPIGTEAEALYREEKRT
ncbi:hypothetical protein ABZW11_16970 [Nonomuraea sp. NPDC004580]|uniref:hypothetical protein n=1 Tax=Nonomuraea sp. NPDC004580 TaxID=3154552 RepID=UPI0033ADBC0B